MSSLEERARAAVRATAAEIGPDDVPPMRAIGSGAGHSAAGGRGPGRRPGRRSRGGPRGRHWAAPLAAAAAVLAVIATAGMLAGVLPPHARHPAVSSSRTAEPSPKHTQGKAAEPSYPPNLEAGLIGYFLPASGAQFTAGALFIGEYRQLAGKITGLCMERAGYPNPGTQTPAEIARAFWDLTDFPDLGAIARAGTLPSYSVPAESTESKAYQRAYEHCATVGLSPFTRMLNAGRTLGSPFAASVADIEASAPVMATIPELRACASRYGWPHDPYGADRPLNSFADFVTWVSGHIDGADSRGASDPTMKALDRHWGAVFVQCARPTVAVMERLDLSAQRVFLARHQRQLAALATIARDDFARAEELAG